MKVVETKLSGIYIIEPDVLSDRRGYFFESYHYERFQQGGLNAIFVQDNQSFSVYGTLRGLHFQKGEWTQAKLVRVLLGKVYDVVVDIRTESPTFGQWLALELSENDHRMLYISRGFAHGFVTLSSSALFVYKCDNYYESQASCGIFYADPFLNIPWPIPVDNRLISDQDCSWPSFKDADI